MPCLRASWPVRTPCDVDTIAGDKLLGQIPAIANGNWYAETDKANAMASTNPTPLSIPVIISDFLPNVVEALEGEVYDSTIVIKDLTLVKDGRTKRFVPPPGAFVETVGGR